MMKCKFLNSNEYTWKQIKQSETLKFEKNSTQIDIDIKFWFPLTFKKQKENRIEK